MSEDFELTVDQSMPKREPVQVSSDELDDNTEKELEKQELRNEITQEDTDGASSATDKAASA
eukprot:CAMPEP_0170461064 /NCGR_PEP_ID=MMETSP0123-20130129/7133_1 /TAXON_ID=182087 /ORGANISM="Favella ehrenbergii, Strain Fehren 1" /LENGTH=61 /DNA_ID=CAMNT_0010726037 /DNA_START=1531 /DNA_END=1716 /DNA_ORIENTATION=+